MTAMVLRAVAPVLLAAAVGCAGARRSDVRGQISQSTRDLEDAPTVRAAAARGEAALADESGPTLFDGVELRARGLSADHFSQGEDIEFSARLEMNNPWAMASERRAQRAETDLALAELEQASLQVRADRCRASMESSAGEARLRFYQWYRSRLETVLEWNRQCKVAGTVDELRAQRLHIEGTARLAQREPRPVGPRPASGFELPALGPGQGALRIDPALVLEQVAQHQPEVEVRRAARRRHQELARQAQRRRLPWFEFVELGYELSENNTAANFTGQISLEVPFGIDHRAEARRHQALGRGEELEAEAIAAELTTRAIEALAAVAFFESRGDRLASLAGEIRATQELADRWLDGRMGEPLDVARLIDNAYGAHETVVQARLGAGLAGCELLETTGIPLSQWPRSENERAGEP